MLKTYLVIGGVLLAGGGLIDRCAPVVGASAEIKRAKAEALAQQTRAESAERSALGWKASFKQAEALRDREAAQARAAVAEASAACEARITKARQSAAAIAAIVTKEPKRDPNGCPRRELVDPRELRDALNPRR